MVVQLTDDAEPPIDERSDEALLALLTQREQRALVALYDRYGTRVFALASRLLGDSQVAEEVTQDVFLRLWQRAETFHPGTSSFLAWLLAITRNRSIDEMRSRRAIARRRESLELTNTAAAAADAAARSRAGGLRRPDPQRDRCRARLAARHGQELAARGPPAAPQYAGPGLARRVA